MGSRGRACPQAPNQGPPSCSSHQPVPNPVLGAGSCLVRPCPLPCNFLVKAGDGPRVWSQVSFLREGRTKCCPAANTKEPGEVAISIGTRTPSQGSRLWAGASLPDPLPSCLAGADPLPAAHKAGLSVPSPLSCGSTRRPMTQPEPADSMA